MKKKEHTHVPPPIKEQNWSLSCFRFRGAQGLARGLAMELLGPDSQAAPGKLMEQSRRSCLSPGRSPTCPGGFRLPSCLGTRGAFPGLATRVLRRHPLNWQEISNPLGRTMLCWREVFGAQPPTTQGSLGIRALLWLPSYRGHTAGQGGPGQGHRVPIPAMPFPARRCLWHSSQD